MKAIKIRNKIYEIIKGDYILDNGACLQFCSGDNRMLDFKDWSKITSIIVSESLLKKNGILIKDLKKVESGDKSKNTYSAKWVL